MAFGNDPGVEDGLTYSGLEWRLMDAMALQANGSAGGATGGVRPGDPGLFVSLVGTTITVAAGVAAIFWPAFGLYRACSSSSTTLTLSAADPTNPRIDLVYLRVWDNAVDGTGLFKADTVYLAGTPAVSPVAPTPAGTVIYLPLATIAVPKVGGGSASVTDVRPPAIGPGGISPNAAAAGTYAGQYRDGGTLQRYNGSTWASKLPLTATGVIDWGGSGGTAPLSMLLAASNSDVINTRGGADTVGRFLSSADGTMAWGPGNAARDTTLARTGVGALSLTGSLAVSNGLSVPAGVGSRRTFWKPTDTSRASTTTYAADPYFTGMALEANATYAVDGMLQYNGNLVGTGDMKIFFTGPAGWSMNFALGGITTGGATTFDGTAPAAATGRVFGTNGTGTDMACHALATITTSSTAGSLVLLWAQNTSSATATILRGGSWLRLERVS